MGLHTGEPAVDAEGYLGVDVVRAARLSAAGSGGHVLLSETTRALVGSSVPRGVSVHPLGERRLKDIEEPERVYELAIEGVEQPEAEPASAVGSADDWERRHKELVDRMTARINERVFETLERSLGGFDDHVDPGAPLPGSPWMPFAHRRRDSGRRNVRRSMKQPETKLDRRFSDPNAVATEWAETRRMLEKAELFWISTVRADGRPHVTPLVAVWLEDAIHFTTGPTEQKAVNLRGNSNVILMTGCNEWNRGLDIVVEGKAVQITDDDLLGRLADSWATKWDGRWHFEGPRRRLRARRWWRGLGVLGDGDQNLRLRKGHLRADTTPVLKPTPADLGKTLSRRRLQRPGRVTRRFPRHHSGRRGVATRVRVCWIPENDSLEKSCGGALASAVCCISSC